LWTQKKEAQTPKFARFRRNWGLFSHTMKLCIAVGLLATALAGNLAMNGRPNLFDPRLRWVGPRGGAESAFTWSFDRLLGSKTPQGRFQRRNG
jgi:hypothetical protein